MSDESGSARQRGVFDVRRMGLLASALALLMALGPLAVLADVPPVANRMQATIEGDTRSTSC